jgi:molybdate transport system substrate-binding protein
MFAAVLCVLSGLPMPATATTPTPTLTVFAAASLADVLQELGNQYTRDTGVKVIFSFAASSMLARQIENGAQADLFLCADQEWMDYLDQRGLIRHASRHNLVGNRLALVARADSPIQLTMAPHFPLRAALQGERLAVADPDSVPAGRYARSALVSLGVWDEVALRLVRAENVRAALVFVTRGEAPLGIVYETDALIEHKVKIVGLFPEDSHAPITYPVALTSVASAPSQALIDYLDGPAAQAAYRKYGFSIAHK